MTAASPGTWKLLQRGFDPLKACTSVDISSEVENWRISVSSAVEHLWEWHKGKRLS